MLPKAPAVYGHDPVAVSPCSLGACGCLPPRHGESTGLDLGGRGTPLFWGCLSSHQLWHTPVGTCSSYFPSLCPLLLLLFSRLVVSNSLWPHGLQHTRIPCLHYLPEFAQTHVRWVDDVIQPSHPVAPFSSCPQSFLVSFPPFPRVFSNELTFHIMLSIENKINSQGCVEQLCKGLGWSLMHGGCSTHSVIIERR